MSVVFNIFAHLNVMLDYTSPPYFFRDVYNEWTQIGTFHPLGSLHAQMSKHQYRVPGWGEQVTSHAFKGHVFCCTVA